MTNHVNHSVRLNVHTWSDHPEVNHLVEEVWNALGEDRQSTLSSKSNRKGTPPKKILKVLLVHLYATWLDDPTLWTGMSRNRNDYTPNSIYNALHIPFKIKDITDYLVDLEYLDFEMGRNDRTYDGWYSYTSRIRPTQSLDSLFKKCTATLYDINGHEDEIPVTLTEFNVDSAGNLIKRRGKKLRKKIEYEQTPFTQAMINRLKRYNELLAKTYIDIPTLDKPFVIRETKKGPQRLAINQTDKFVRRIFSRGEWHYNGRFYGGWWQQVGEDYRKYILIDDKPTVEIDYKGIHPSILSINKGKSFNGYEIETPNEDQKVKEELRKATKLLVLTAMNAASKEQAFKAFRKNYPIKFKNKELEALLQQFVKLNPHLEEDLCTDKGISLMNIDSKIAEYVINKFTEQNIPILTVHDSFIVQTDQQQTLKLYMEEATLEVLGTKIEFEQDYVSLNAKEAGKLNVIKVKDPKNLMGDKEEIEITQRYLSTYKKFKLWKESNNVC